MDKKDKLVWRLNLESDIEAFDFAVEHDFAKDRAKIRLADSLAVFIDLADPGDPFDRQIISLAKERLGIE